MVTYGISRDQALALVRKHIHSTRLINHSLASEAVMRRLAEELGEDPEKWGLAGLLHDLDVEETADDLSRHTHETVAILQGYDLDAEIIEAIRLHNESAHPDRRNEKFHHALAAAETITGLVIATALVYPDKKLASVKPKSVRKRYKEKAFAAGADRAIIAECEQLGIPLDQFCNLALEALQGIAEELGL